MHFHECQIMPDKDNLIALVWALVIIGGIALIWWLSSSAFGAEHCAHIDAWMPTHGSVTLDITPGEGDCAVWQYHYPRSGDWRSRRELHLFEVETGWPHGREGYWVDHVRPHECGGADTPANMAWQKKRDAMAKDRWERKDCSVWLRPDPPCIVIGKERDEVCPPTRAWPK